MATQLEDHNQGQKDGTDAGFLDTMAMEWNPLLSSAYKQGFRHAVEQQPKKKAQEIIPEKQSSKIDEDEGIPLVISLLLAYFVIVISGAVFLLSWTIKRPWRVAVILLIVVGIAISSRQEDRHQEATVRVSESPAAVSLPTARDAPQSSGQETNGKMAETSRREAAPTNEDNSLPTKVVSQYWLAVAAEDYKSAWNLLSLNFREKNHAGDYDNYVRARQSMHVCSVAAEGLEPRDTRRGTAVVEGAVIFKAGRMCRESKEKFYFYLVNGGRQDWLIDRVARR
jgi:hypothetical protein